MPVERTSIEGLLVSRWDDHPDDRGFFRQTYQTSELHAALGRSIRFVQGNHARSRPGVLRGFHAEDWDKLVHVARGTAFCAIADVRPDSATFGEVATFTVGDAPGDRLGLFVTAGLANAYVALTDVDYVYDVTREWRPEEVHDKRAVAWDDPDLAVAWPVPDPTLSEEDRRNPTLRDRFPGHPRFDG